MDPGYCECSKNLLHPIHDVVLPRMVDDLEPDVLTCAGLIDVLVFILHGSNRLRKVRGVAFYMDRISDLERTFVQLCHRHAEMAVIMGNNTDGFFI